MPRLQQWAELLFPTGMGPFGPHHLPAASAASEARVSTPTASGPWMDGLCFRTVAGAWQCWSQFAKHTAFPISEYVLRGQGKEGC